MLGEYSELLLFLPILIRIAVGIIILAVLYDYLRRKLARMIVDTVKSVGAESPETAKTTSELEAVKKGFGRSAAFLLRKHSPLRRYVKCTTDSGDGLEFDISGADGTSYIDKKKKTESDNAEESGKAAKKATKKAERIANQKRNKIIEKSFTYKARRLTGKEKWYIEPYCGNTDTEAEAARDRLPYLLRDGAEPKIVPALIGCIAVALLGEVIVHYLPAVMDFFVKLAELKK